jgi:hypothetical protein
MMAKAKELAREACSLALDRAIASSYRRELSNVIELLDV